MRLNLMLAGVVSLLAACSTGSAPVTDPRNSVAAHQQRWEAAGVESYRFDFQQQCFCVREQVQPVTIEVRAGRITRVLSRETGEDVSAAAQWYTISDLFRVAAEAEARGVTPLVVRYHAQLGYPTHIEAGTLANDAGVIYSAANVQPLTN